jgi:hypothetical protein
LDVPNSSITLHIPHGNRYSGILPGESYIGIRALADIFLCALKYPTVVKLYKVVWSNHGERDVTWEREDYLRDNYSTFYTKWYAFQISGQDFYKGEGCNTLGVWLAFVHVHCIT